MASNTTTRTISSSTTDTTTHTATTSMPTRPSKTHMPNHARPTRTPPTHAHLIHTPPTRAHPTRMPMSILPTHTSSVSQPMTRTAATTMGSVRSVWLPRPLTARVHRVRLTLPSRPFKLPNLNTSSRTILTVSCNRQSPTSDREAITMVRSAKVGGSSRYLLRMALRPAAPRGRAISPGQKSLVTIRRTVGAWR